MQKVILIVGASSGIGMYTAQRYIGDGDIVVNLSRRDCEIEGVINIRCDVCDDNSVEKAFNSFLSISNRLDVFIYSAGFSMASPMEYVEEKDYRYLFDVNLFGYMFLLKKCIPLLKLTGGVSCIVSSTAAVVPIAYDCFYSASKAAANMLTISLCQELLPQGIRVLSVMPGGTRTNFTFKRKEYPPEVTCEYADYVKTAADSLAEIEQKGMKAKSVARTIYNKCNSKISSGIYASGVGNKLLAFLVRLLPQRIIYYMVRSQFGLNGK